LLDYLIQFYNIRGRIRVLTYFSLFYRFLIILPVSELVVYRGLDDRVERRGRLGGSRESRWKVIGEG
jgi:hypothetical protein